MTPRSADKIVEAAMQWAEARQRRLAAGTAIRDAEIAEKEAFLRAGGWRGLEGNREAAAEYLHHSDRKRWAEGVRAQAKREETAALRELAKLCPIERNLPMADVVVALEQQL